MNPVSVICLFCDLKYKANHSDSEALRSPMTNLNWHDALRKNMYNILYVCIVLRACMCINTCIRVFSPSMQIALPLLGDIGVLLKVLCCYVRNYMLIFRKKEKGSLYQKLN